MNIFGGMKILCIFFWGAGERSSHKIGIYCSFLCILGSFLKVNVQVGGYFLRLLK